MIDGMPTRLHTLDTKPNISGRPNKGQRDVMINPLGRIDLGHILSFLDWRAGMFAQDYLPKDIGPVTVGVESSTIYAPLSAQHAHHANLTLIRSGDKSLEVQADWLRSQDNGDIDLVASIYFNFVAIDENGRPVSAAPDLNLKGNLETAINDEAEQRKRRNTTAPEKYDTVSSQIKEMRREFENPFHSEKYVLPGELQFTVPSYARRDERNIHGILFGGYIMQQMYKHAWNGARVTLSKMEKDRPAPYPLVAAVSNVSFRAPVKPGWVTDYTVRPIFSSDSSLVQQVTLNTYDPLNPKTPYETNTATFVFVPADENLIARSMPKQILPYHHDDIGPWMRAYDKHKANKTDSKRPLLPESTLRLLGE